MCVSFNFQSDDDDDDDDESCRSDLENHRCAMGHRIYMFYIIVSRGLWIIYGFSELFLLAFFTFQRCFSGDICERELTRDNNCSLLKGTHRFIIAHLEMDLNHGDSLFVLF